MRTSEKISQKEANNNAEIDWLWAGQIVDNYAIIYSSTDPCMKQSYTAETTLNCDIVIRGTVTTIKTSSKGIVFLHQNYFTHEAFVVKSLGIRFIASHTCTS